LLVICHIIANLKYWGKFTMHSIVKKNCHLYILCEYLEDCSFVLHQLSVVSLLNLCTESSKRWCPRSHVFM